MNITLGISLPIIAAIALTAWSQENGDVNAKPVTMQMVEPWKEVTVKLVDLNIAQHEPSSGSAVAVQAKQAVYRSIPKPPPAEGSETFHVLRIHDPTNKKYVFIRPGFAFYISAPETKGYDVLPSALVWRHSYFEVPDAVGERSATAKFEQEFDPQNLNRELWNPLFNRMDLKRFLPMSFFSDARGLDGVGGWATNPDVKGVGFTNGVLRLELRNPKTQVQASIWINLEEKRVIRSVADGQEMDLNSGKPWAVPLKGK